MFQPFYLKKEVTQKNFLKGHGKRVPFSLGQLPRDFDDHTHLHELLSALVFSAFRDF